MNGRAQPRALCIDVGAGTTDILLTQPGQPLENAVKLVVPSATQVIARRISAATARRATVVLHGPTMGGGASTSAMKRHLASDCPFVAGETAALTFADDPERARRLGVRIVTDEEAAALLAPERHGLVEVRSGDVDAEALLEALTRLGVEPRFDAVAVAVQDHGFSPHGSNRVVRFALWERAVADERPLASLFHDEHTLPAGLTRLRAALAAAHDLAARGAAPGDGGPGDAGDGGEGQALKGGDEDAGDDAARVLVADTGPAALYGVLPPGRADAVLVNVGNSHTICAVARAGRLAGVFEHHTRRLDGPGLDERLRRFLAGDLGGDEVREDGGHGAVLSGAIPGGLPLIATGPRRALLEDCSLPFEFAAPHGDMMLTGCFGLLRALDERGHADSRPPASPR